MLHSTTSDPAKLYFYPAISHESLNYMVIMAVSARMGKEQFALVSKPLKQTVCSMKSATQYGMLKKIGSA